MKKRKPQPWPAKRAHFNPKAIRREQRQLEEYYAKQAKDNAK